MKNLKEKYLRSLSESVMMKEESGRYFFLRKLYFFMI